ncbi:hypothetical protein SNARM312S_04628 [Streptomyces narbonensis]
MTVGRSPFLRPRPVDDPAVRLIGFHHAGGSAAVYYPFVRHLPADWDLLLLDLPGRGRRATAPQLDEMAEVVETVVADVLPWADDDAPFALFGHSMGAVVALETARALEALGRCRTPDRSPSANRTAPTPRSGRPARRSRGASSATTYPSC